MRYLVCALALTLAACAKDSTPSSTSDPLAAVWTQATPNSGETAYVFDFSQIRTGTVGLTLNAGEQCSCTASSIDTLELTMTCANTSTNCNNLTGSWYYALGTDQLIAGPLHGPYYIYH